MGMILDIVLIAVAFAAGGATWNYFGPRIKGALHAEEKKLGARISQVVQLKDKP